MVKGEAVVGGMTESLYLIALGTGPILSSNLHVCSPLSPLGPAP